MKLYRRAINEAVRARIKPKRRKQAAQEMDDLRAVVPKFSTPEVARWSSEPAQRLQLSRARSRFDQSSLSLCVFQSPSPGSNTTEAGSTTP
jgi:hypothetical protein